MTWGKILLPKIRRIIPSVIAQDIVGVQPMVMPKDLSILSAQVLTYAQYATNSDGVIFRFYPVVGKDDNQCFVLIKVTFYESTTGEYVDIIEMMIDVSMLNGVQVNDFIKSGIAKLIEQIDDLSISESFNTKTALKILEEEKSTFECIKRKNQEDITT